MGSGMDASTIFPRTDGSHPVACSAEVKSGMAITSASTGLPPVPGLHASKRASSVCARGATRSACTGPRRHPRQVPYCSLRASMPQDAYVASTQSTAA